MVYKIQCTWYD